jgi:hypothetical protein
MTITADLGIHRIGVVDDDATVRSGYGDAILDLGAEPIFEAGPLGSLAQFLGELANKYEAAVCDFTLRSANYAEFDGAELVSELYRRKTPAILCTQWQTRIDEMRKYQQWIPCVLSPEQLNVDTIGEGLAICIREFNGDYSERRRPWRTLVRFEDADVHFAYLVIPGWQAKTGLKLVLRDLPGWLQREVANRQGAYRAYVQCNLGAEHQDDLYFTDWERGA